MELNYEVADAVFLLSDSLMAYCALGNEIEICTLWNGNLYFVEWKSVLCEIENCALRNETLTQ